MYLYDKNRITYFAETDRRNKRVPFGIKAEDRTRHMYIIGKMGKPEVIVKHYGMWISHINDAVRQITLL